jgi:DNA repair photolyase
VQALASAGVKVNVAIAPVLPGISDAPEQLEAVVRAADESGATNVWANLLHLRSGTREHFLACLARDWPQHLDRYRELYRYNAYLPDEARAPSQLRVRELKARYGVGEHSLPVIEAPPRPQQLELLRVPGAPSPPACHGHH